MPEYIERDAAIRVLCDACGNAACPKGLIPRCSYYEKMQSIPAADVRPVVKAEWYGEADGYADGELVYDMWSCPICGKRFEEWEEKPDWNYCPNCGARMEVDTNDS